MDARVETFEPMKVAFVRHTGPYEQCQEAWGKLCQWAGPKGLFGPQTVMLGISYDDPEVTPPDKIRYDACMSLDRDIPTEGDVGIQTVGGGKYATTTHYGPYPGLAETYGKLYGQWIPANNLQIRSGTPCMEIYRNDPNTTPPDELRTDVFVPVEG